MVIIFKVCINVFVFSYSKIIPSLIELSLLELQELLNFQVSLHLNESGNHYRVKNRILPHYWPLCSLFPVLFAGGYSSIGSEAVVL